MKLKLLFAGVLVLWLAGYAGAQATYSNPKRLTLDGANAKHNLSASSTSTGLHAAGGGFDQICAFCHVVHQPTAANKQDPLWNHNLSAAGPYGLYGSTTFDALGTDIAQLPIAPTDGTATTSHLCLSCHDGTVGVNQAFKNPEPGGTTPLPGFGGGNLVTGNPVIGTDLSDDHPVNFTFTSAGPVGVGKNPNLATPSGTTVGTDALPLYSGKLQCATCHNAHDNSNGKYLRVSNTASRLCLNCHGI